MSSRSKWIFGILGLVVVLSIFDYFRVEYRVISFTEAREMAERRFTVIAEGYGLKPSDFGSPCIEDRGDEWTFDWAYLKGDGRISVMIRRNGELFDGGDERLEPKARK